MDKKISLGVSMAIVILVAVAAATMGWKYGKNQPSKSNEKSLSVPALSPSTQQDSGNQSALKKDETADWKTYKNDKYGFEIKYPPSWKAEENAGLNYDSSVVSLASPATQKLIEDYQKQQGKNYPYQDDISIYYYESIADEPANKTGRLGATTLDELLKKDPMVVKIIGATELGGVPAKEVIYGGESSYYAVLLAKDSHLYKVWFSKKDSKDKLTSEEKQIINAFKFN